MDVIDTLQKDTLRDYLTENSKPYEEKNYSRIQMYRNLLRENSKLLSDLSAGSPIISQVKARIDEAESRANQISPALSISNETDSSWR